ncbi:MAG: acetylglutamate kinase [Magnetococcales bacterium]|nr:acetylglutamate kinase [Magnetococcales bacterium]
MPLEDRVDKARVLIESLPYMRRFDGKTFVIKYGGHAMVDEALKVSFVKDIILMRQVGIKPVVVHGGGPQIGQTMSRMGLKPHFVDGLRVTDQETVNVVEMVLAGKVNKDIVSLINLNGGRAVGLSGKDGHTIQARKRQHIRQGPELETPEIIDLGWVGDVERIDTTLLDLLSHSTLIPVIAPVGVGEAGETYNINADTVSGAIAVALKAEKLILLTDVLGVKDKSGRLISELHTTDVGGLIHQGTVTGGMIPKVETCVKAIEGGVVSTHIIDGRIEHALLLEVFTDKGVGTCVR